MSMCLISAHSKDTDTTQFLKKKDTMIVSLLDAVAVWLPNYY